MSRSLAATSAQGSAPWRITNLSSGKNQHTSSMSMVSWQAEGTRGPQMPVHTQIGMSSSMHLA